MEAINKKIKSIERETEEAQKANLIEFRKIKEELQKESQLLLEKKLLQLRREHRKKQEEIEKRKAIETRKAIEKRKASEKRKALIGKHTEIIGKRKKALEKRKKEFEISKEIIEKEAREIEKDRREIERREEIIKKIEENQIAPEDDINEPIIQNEDHDSMLGAHANNYHYYLPSRGKTYNPESFLSAKKNKVLRRITPRLKVKLVLQCKMVRTDEETGKKSTCDALFHSRYEYIWENSDTDEIYEEMSDRILENIATYIKSGSNWRFDSIIKLKLCTDEHNPSGGARWIPIPQALAVKKALINMKNEDNECFKWSVVRALNPVKNNSERITKILKIQAEKLNWGDLEFPLKLKDISKFEKLNDISINVYGYENNEVYPRIVCEKEKEKHVDLLLFQNAHYVLIKDLGKLLSRQYSKHTGRKFLCKSCLNSFTSQERLDTHKELCRTKGAVKIEMPKPFTFLHFKNFKNSQKVPFAIYADFESFTNKIDVQNKSTHKLQEHTPSGFCLYIHSDVIEIEKKVIMYTKKSDDEDMGQIFIDTLEEVYKKLYQKIKWPKKMIFTRDDKEIFDSVFNCHICKKELSSDKVRDHCHLTGQFRGAAHNKCNLNYQVPKFIPIFFHNLSGYDAHLFIKNLGVSEGKINCIPNNEEKYISFSKEIVVDEFTNKEGKNVLIKRTLRFIDSYKFMSESLNKLVENLKNSDHDFKILKKEFGEIDLLKQKGVYPYDYMDCLEKLNETCLPPIEEFYSKLNDSDISKEDYEHAQNVWKTFKIKDMRGYHDLYLKTDVLLLAEVFGKFRSVCLENYKLDPCWYYTAPGLAFDALLKKTEIKLELFSDIDMLLMVENGIRGGVAMITKRYAKANNPGVEGYDKTKKKSFIKYFDANNLYGWAMSQPLPTEGFKWMTSEQIKNWEKYPCILEVDLDYPDHLHDLHNEYPLAPERLMLGKVEKLVPNLGNKNKYVLHSRNLKQYLTLGLKLTKIHRAITFKESPWMKPYIDLNTELRKNAKNDFEKDFYKLMNNSVFGKTCENIRNRKDIILVNNRKKAAKLVAKPNFVHRTIFNENLGAYHMAKTKIVYNKPVYLGMCILDLSKTLMYDFHYNYIKAKFGSKAELLFTDTDSLCYEIETDDFNKDIKPDLDKFDTSNYDSNHELYSLENKKVIGKFKDECGGKEIREFVGLRAKLYALKVAEREEKKCKGIKRNVVENQITFEDYYNCLMSGENIYRKNVTIRSYKHNVYTEEINKIALSSNDDKRHILDDKINTLALKHQCLREMTALILG